MTGITVLGRALVHAIGMAGTTLHIAVTSIQWEACIGMIESCPTPTTGSMTGSTICAELAVVSVLGSMTSVAILRCAFENTVLMTGSTLGITVPSSQCKPGILGMIEGHIPPAARVMAGTTIRAELSVMGVPCSVTAITILRCTFENPVLMTGCTGNTLMLSI